jgi:hypothetical protein
VKPPGAMPGSGSMPGERGGEAGGGLQAHLAPDATTRRVGAQSPSVGGSAGRLGNDLGAGWARSVPIWPRGQGRGAAHRLATDRHAQDPGQPLTSARPTGQPVSQ